MHETELFALERIQFERRRRRRSGMYIYTYIIILYTYTGLRMTAVCRSDARCGYVRLCECVSVCGCVGGLLGDGWKEGRRANVTRRRYIKRVIGLQKRVPAHRSAAASAAAISSSYYYYMIAIEHATMMMS